MGIWTEHKHQQQETEKNTMKTFLLLTSLLAVALVNQAAEVKLTLDDGLGKALLDLASGGQQKREEGFADDSDESQGEKRELDESDFQGEAGELYGLVDDLEQKREMGEGPSQAHRHAQAGCFADDSDESQGEKRDLDERDLLGQKGKLAGLVDDLEQKREMGKLLPSPLALTTRLYNLPVLQL
ncbi:UNVERIFIED_CONTAM: hypothetical protein FKN15_060425 [Acipenser sinensis]